jgi:ferredoxin
MRGARRADFVDEGEKTEKAEKARLRIDPVSCEGLGMCAHLAPRLIDLDPWGFPVIPLTDLEGPDRRAAVRAVRGCPRRALHVSVE